MAPSFQSSAAIALPPDGGYKATSRLAPDADIWDAMSLRLCQVKNEGAESGGENGLTSTRVDGRNVPAGQRRGPYGI
jgi:hypothetical protein